MTESRLYWMGFPVAHQYITIFYEKKGKGKAPLRNSKRTSSPACEQNSQEITNARTSHTELRPFKLELKTIHVADAGPEGIVSNVR